MRENRPSMLPLTRYSMCRQVLPSVKFTRLVVSCRLVSHWNPCQRHFCRVELSAGYPRVEAAFEAYLRDRWKTTADDRVHSTLMARAVQDFAERAKRKFRDPALPFFVEVGPPNLLDRELNIYQGRIEIPG